MLMEVALKSIHLAVAFPSLLVCLAACGASRIAPGHVDKSNADMTMYYPDPVLKNDPATLNALADAGTKRGCKPTKTGDIGLVISCVVGTYIFIANPQDSTILTVGCKDGLQANCDQAVTTLREGI